MNVGFWARHGRCFAVFLNSLFAVFLILLLAVVWYLLAPPLMTPLAYSFDPATGTETLTWDADQDVTAQWVRETTIPGGRVCTAAGFAHYEHEMKVITWKVLPQIEPCLRDPDSVTVFEWRPQVFVGLQMRPIRRIFTYAEATAHLEEN